MYTIKDLSFTYPNNRDCTLKKINLEVAKGEYILLLGKSGSGKTTLLRLLKSALAPKGTKSGEILFGGRALDNVDFRSQSAQIGFVGQNPEHQIVCDKVWHELAFGLESLGADRQEIRLKTAEVAAFFGIEDWYEQDVSALSGGQKQILNLASTMVLRPDVLILDEPASRLDPVAAEKFFGLVRRIHTELGTSIIMTSHTPDWVYQHCNRIAVLDKGEIVTADAPSKTAKLLFCQNRTLFSEMPAPVRITAGIAPDNEFSGDMKQVQDILSEAANRQAVKPVSIMEESTSVHAAVTLKGVYFKYGRQNEDILSGVDLKISQGSIFAVVGGNGAGKTTLLRVISGINRIYRGRIKVLGKTAMLPQNPQDLFCCETVYDELREMTDNRGKTADNREKINFVTNLFGLGELLTSHPYDLSGGEQQRTAFAKVFLTGADIFLLDEPTKGMDYEYKVALGNLLRRMSAEGKTVVIVSHDLDFCACFADRVAMLFNGIIVSENEPHIFFDDNRFYTTGANLASKGIVKHAITVDEVISAFSGDIFKPEDGDKTPSTRDETVRHFGDRHFDTENDGRTSGNERLICSPDDYVTKKTLVQIKNNTLTADKEKSSFPKKSNFLKKSTQTAPIKNIPRKPNRILSLLWFLIAMPLTLWAGVHFFDDRRYYFISLLLILEAFVPFWARYEKRKPPARELVLTAVFCAAAVAGRSAFFMIPQFSAMAAIVIVASICFGAEVGFLVGSMAVFISNMLLGQGSWTPYQMAAMGSVGLIAGVLKPPNRLLPWLGGILVFAVYGFIMNTASVIIEQPAPTMEMFFVSILWGMPFDAIHALSTTLFLYLLGGFMIRKTKRVIQKYDILI